MSRVIYGEHDEATLAQVDAVLASGASHFVECADGHLGYSHPIGGVAAYRDHISLSGVGFDIGCGNTCVRTEVRGTDLIPSIALVMDDIARRIAFGVGRRNEYEFGERLWVDHLADHPAWEIPAVAPLKGLAKSQLGTVGSGNHYVDIFVEQATDEVWVGVHFGSRGLGHKIATHYMKAVGARDDMMSPPALLDANSEIGREYLAAMSLAGEYARVGRDAVIYEVIGPILGFVAMSEHVNNHHNFAWRENHHGEDYWVVRKGATPAFPGQLGFVGGSMGDDAVILRGIDSEESRNALYSTVHGAGRTMSRAAARGRKGRPGLVSRDAMRSWINEAGVALRGGDLDEAPQAYRRLPKVLHHHRNTIEILHTLRPVGVAMAGAGEHDPYRD